MVDTLETEYIVEETAWRVAMAASIILVGALTFMLVLGGGDTAAEGNNTHGAVRSPPTVDRNGLDTLLDLNFLNSLFTRWIKDLQDQGYPRQPLPHVTEATLRHRR